ncbi:MAG TPA: capsule assembly Wzi family protein [Candidatus Sulfotelmatobacter sp.]|nr:capsule assembly Wzi family protein [Candidatus Sulfotelmatobacter sp.]
MSKLLSQLALLCALTLATGRASLPAQQPDTSRDSATTAATSAPADPPERTPASAKHIGSPFVELDSWVYPALLRLAALGYIHSEFSDMRPWARMNCALLLEEAASNLDVDPSGSSAEAQRLYSTLRQEFLPELAVLEGAHNEPSIRLESMYSILTGISGTPLNDSYHFGQTIINNYGRPYQQGFNTYDGYSGYADAGSFTIYSRGEFQHAPSAPAYPLAVRQVIASADDNPLQPAAPIATTNQFTLLDTYTALDLSGWNLSVGKQSLWWAPNYGGAFPFSNNAEPIYMARLNQIAPFKFPWIFRYLGLTKLDFFLGTLSGNESPPHPLLHGEKISFKLTRNLELSFSRTGEFAGQGRALTLGALFHTYFSFQSSASYSSSQNPGERNGGFDFSYRIPGLRNWMTLYGDFMSRDDPSPVDAPRRASWSPGLYLAWLPFLPKLDFRLEGVNTDPPSSPARNGQFDYWEGFYHDLNTNQNNLIGDWIGREGTGIQAWSTYWFTPKNTLQFAYRHAKVDPRFIPYGETLNDAAVSLNRWVRDDLQLTGLLQYEKWDAPLLAPAPQANWTTSVTVTFWPKSLKP